MNRILYFVYIIQVWSDGDPTNYIKVNIQVYRCMAHSHLAGWLVGCLFIWCMLLSHQLTWYYRVNGLQFNQLDYHLRIRWNVGTQRILWLQMYVLVYFHLISDHDIFLLCEFRVRVNNTRHVSYIQLQPISCSCMCALHWIPASLSSKT